MGQKETVLPDPVEIAVDVETSAYSKLIVLWDLGDVQLKVERFATCPDSWQPHKVCGKELILSEDNCDYVFYLPGKYRLSPVGGGEIPDHVKYEEDTVSKDTVELYLAEKRACCCG